MSQDEQETSLQLVRRVLDPEKAGDPVHHFQFIRVGNNVLLEAGYLDFAEVKLAIDQSRKTGAPASATLFIQHRLLLTPEAVQQLAEAAREMVEVLGTPVTRGDS